MSALFPAHLAPADKPPPKPIPFPSRAATAERSRIRAGIDNTAWQRQAERIDTLVKAAAHDAHARGERQGYLQGWRWGVVCGACAGGLVVACTWVLWAQALAPWLTAIGRL